MHCLDGERFDYKTGVCAYDGSIKVAKFRVKVQDSEIYVDVTRLLSNNGASARKP